MNRIILLGNGFDLAHGLPTTYKDFVFNYIHGVVNKKEHDDNYITYVNNHMGVDFSNVKTINEILDTMNKKAGIQYSFKNSFLNSALHNLSLNNWIDLEMHYYSNLKYYVDWDKRQIKNEGNIKSFNDSFESVKVLLEDYLSQKVVPQISNFASAYFIDIFNKKINFDEFGKSEHTGHENPKISLFLNFNYTNTIQHYIGEIQGEKIILNIHGELNNPNNPLIFGFGDELDEKYHEIENLNSNELFRHLKSFMYMQTSNYHRLVRFIESGEFEVFIIGHSCGLSDRTMLNYIFEHDNCKSIKIYYYKDKANFIATTHEISRHFKKDKNEMRIKIVPFDKSQICPQSEMIDRKQ